jgi:hypothetical protein
MKYRPCQTRGLAEPAFRVMSLQRAYALLAAAATARRAITWAIWLR